MKPSHFAALARRSVAALPLFVVTVAVAVAQTPSNDSAQTATASATPAPIFTLAPTPAPRPTGPDPFTYSGYVRAYEFYRTNGVQNSSNPNRQAFNFDAAVHLEYHTNSPWYLATTYDAAYPFGLDGQDAAANTHVDNSLPGFALSTFDEAFVGYSNAAVQAKIGDQIINTPWANASDTRVKPAAFQGADFTVAVTPHLSAFFYDMDRFEGRTSSAFGQYTLLTASVPGATNALSPSTAEINTSGFVMGGLAYQPLKNIEIALMDYRFSQIADMLYFEGQTTLTPQSPYHVTMAVQYDHETNDDSSVIGKIDNQTVGVQFAATITKNLTLQASGGYAPWSSANVALGSCSSATYLTTGYYLPSGGTPDCVSHGNGTATVYYGGIASPYTDSYATDPLFTTSISQGMVDRRSAGTSEKASATYQPFARQLRLIVSEGWYNYGNPAGPNLTREINADGTYFLNRVRNGAYKGFSVRFRYADRTQPTLPFDFKYNRAQLEYDF